MTKSATVESHTSRPKLRRLDVALPDPAVSMEQDAEWCVVRVGDEWRQIRFHDYDEIFKIPGLYEQVIYEILQCTSPDVITDLLFRAMEEEPESPEPLRVLDLGAGNGMVGELLADRGAELVVGVDIIEEAAMATHRDRPGIYDSYHVTDLTCLAADERRELAGYRFNCLTCVAALGFGDIPAEAFKTAYNLISDDGWIAFNIKEEFVNNRGSTGFAGLVRTMTEEGIWEVRCRHRYPHRLGTDREPIYYVALVGQKRRNIP